MRDPSSKTAFRRATGLARSLLRRLRGESGAGVSSRVRWQGTHSEEDATRALAYHGGRFVAGNGAAWVLTLGDGGPLHARLNALLQSAGVAFRAQDAETVAAWGQDEAAGLAGVLCAYRDVARITAAARLLAAHPVLGRVPFEYAAGLHREREVFAQLDEYAQTDFIAPSLLDQPGPYAIYEESLRLFEQKCGLRDYLDLYQMLRYVTDSGVAGDIAEFGSFRGHSGWLIARTLQALGSDKKLFMFDTFSEFPEESVGVDHFWSRTHHVNFEEVRAKLAPFPNVTLVKGDFTQTLGASGLGAVAIAYIDCDSYRATRFLIDALWERQLTTHGVLVCEDYGHPALLGNRVAVHESLGPARKAFRYFSQFSGFYVALKL